MVAFDSGAASEHVVDRFNGRLVTPGDDAGFVTAVCLMTSLHGCQQAAVRAARQSVAGQGWDKALRSFEQHLLAAAGVVEPVPADAVCVT